MPQFQVEVRVMPRPTLLDPQGQAVQHALQELGFHSVSDVRMGKAVSFAVEGPDAREAERHVREMCQRLLSNPVTEDFTVSVTQVL
jgi:phosphoribosylformylglycinamidine synthase subunit PurS